MNMDIRHVLNSLQSSRQPILLLNKNARIKTRVPNQVQSKGSNSSYTDIRAKLENAHYHVYNATASE